MMKQGSLESLIRKLTLGWTIAGILLTLAFSGGLFQWITYLDAENQIETLAKSALSSYRTDILSGGIRSIELNLRRDFSISADENLFFLDANKLPWVGSLQKSKIRNCSHPSGICGNIWERKIVIEKPIYFDEESKSLWGYLHIEKVPRTDWSLVFSVTLTIIFGMLLQNLGLYFSHLKVIKSVCATLTGWAQKLSTNPKDAMNYESAPFDEIKPVELALAGLKTEIDELENMARQQGELAMLRSVGHDILNPVSRMKRIVGLLEIQSDPNYAELLLRLNANLKRLSSYAEQLKFIYKRRSGERVDVVTPLNISTEIKALTDELAFDPEAQEKQIVIKTELAPDCHIRIPAPAFSRIIENLCGNSIQASNQSQIVSIQVSSDQNLVQIMVKDSGCGIPEVNQKKIFEPGFTTKVNKGTGLGLFVVKQICEQFGGTISLDSQVGRGTCIKLEFPRIEVKNVLQTALG